MFVLPKNMEKDLDDFFAKKTIMDVDRSTFLTCGLKDITYNLDIVFFFMKNWHGEYSDYSEMDIEGKGAIFVFPSYWVSVPKPLVMEYFTYILQNFYDNTVSRWGLGYNSNYNIDSVDNNTICPCPC